MADDVEVTQDDREAAADLVPENARSGVLAGFSDKQPLLQILARHRIASVRAAAMSDLIAGDADLYDAPSDDLVERVWEALKAECCSDPKKATRCVMVEKRHLAAAIAAVGQDTRSQVERDIVAWLRKDALKAWGADASGADETSFIADAIEQGQYRSEQ